MVNEFVLLWLHDADSWSVIMATGMTSDVSGTAGAALSFALRKLGASEAEFDLVEETSNYYRYARDPNRGVLCRS